MQRARAAASRSGRVDGLLQAAELHALRGERAEQRRFAQQVLALPTLASDQKALAELKAIAKYLSSLPSELSVKPNPKFR